MDSPLVVEHELYQQSAAAQSYETYGNQQSQAHQQTVSQNSVEEPTQYGNRPSLQSHYRPSNLGAPQSNYGGVSVDDENSNSVDGLLDNTKDKYGTPPKVVLVDNDSVSVSSPSPEYASSTASSYYGSSSAQYYPSVEDTYPSSSAEQQDELPTRITTGPYEVSSIEASGSGAVIGSGPDAYSDFADQIMHIQSSDFTHSGITHPGVDAVIVDKDTTGYGGPSIGISSSSVQESTHSTTTTTERAHVPSTTTEKTFKITHAKPVFRPKPTKVVQINTPDSDKYVLIQTINHDVPVRVETPTKQHDAMTENDIESIESIILMLNDTKTGPQYNSESSSTESGSTFYHDDHTSTIYGVQGTTSHQSSTSSIDYEKYGPSSHYVTEKISASTIKPPSTSYVYSPQPTGRPIQVQSTISSSYGALHQDINPDHLSVPSSSEGYLSTSSDLVTKRPILITSSSFATVSKLPSSGYYGTPTTVRPLAHDESVTTFGTKKPQTPRPVTKRPVTTTHSSTVRPKIPEKTTVKIPSTSFAYSTTVPPKRITTKPTNRINPNRKNVSESARPSPTFDPITVSTILYEEVLQSKPLGQVHNAAPTTERPSPTVHITPKPTSNQVTSSFSPQSPSNINHYTTPLINAPSTSYIFSSTQRPNYDYSTPSYSTGYGSPIIYSSTPTNPTSVSNDFDDSGYYGPSSTYRPASNSGFPSSPIPSHPPFYGPISTFGPEVQHFVEYSTIRDEIDTSQNDFNNFPPVRNPNLNTTSNGAFQPINDYEISTPSFVEDEVLNDKMGVLVSKIVESLQGNFEQLADVVYDDVIQQDPVPASTKRPSAASSKRPATTKRPVTSAARPATTTKVTTARPAITTKKPTAVRVTTTTKKPTSATATPSRRTTKKPTSSTTIITKKPVVTKVSKTLFSAPVVSHSTPSRFPALEDPQQSPQKKSSPPPSPSKTRSLTRRMKKRRVRRRRRREPVRRIRSRRPPSKKDDYVRMIID